MVKVSSVGITPFPLQTWHLLLILILLMMNLLKTKNPAFQRVDGLPCLYTSTALRLNKRRHGMAALADLGDARGIPQQGPQTGYSIVSPRVHFRTFFPYLLPLYIPMGNGQIGDVLAMTFCINLLYFVFYSNLNFLEQHECARGIILATFLWEFMIILFNAS